MLELVVVPALVPPPTELVGVVPVVGVELLDDELEPVLPVVPVVPVVDVACDGVTVVVTVGCAAMLGTFCGAFSDSVTPPQPAIASAPRAVAVRALARGERRQGSGVRMLKPRSGPSGARTSGNR